MANGTNGRPRQQSGAPRQGNASANGAQRPPKKADVIIQITRDISKKQEDVRNQTQLINNKLESVADLSNQSKANSQEAITKSDVVYNLVVDSITALKNEITYLAAQNENIYLNLNEKLAELSNTVDELKQGKAEEAPAKYEAVQEAPQQVAIDYDLLSDKIAGKMPAPVQQYAAAGTPVVTQPVSINYDELSEKVAARIPASSANVDYDTLAKKVAQYVGTAPASAPTPVVVTSNGDTTIDYEYLSDKVASKVLAAKSENTVAPAIDVDALANKVASKLHIEAPAITATLAVDYDTLASKVAEKLHIDVPVQTATVTVDYDALADKVAGKIHVDVPAAPAVDYEYLSDKVAGKIHVDVPAAPAVDYEYLSDKVAGKIQIEVPEAPAAPAVDYEYLSDKVAGKIHVEVPAAPAAPAVDYEYLSDKVAGKIQIEVPAAPAAPAVDYEYLSDKVANKIQIEVPETPAAAEIDYETLADKVADRIHIDLPAQAAASTVDYEYLADKVAGKIHVDVPAAPAAPAVDYEYLADKVAGKIHIDVPEAPAAPAVDYDYLANKLASKVNAGTPAPSPVVVTSSGDSTIDYEYLASKVASKIHVDVPAAPAAPAVDYEYLASKVAGKIHVDVPEAPAATVDYEYLADKVAERIPAGESGEPVAVEIDYDTLADKVADRIITEKPAEASAPEIDYDALADKVAERIPASEPAQPVEAAPAEIHIDEESLAEKIALKVSAANKNDDIDIVIDDEGCESLSQAISAKIDYDTIAAAISERLSVALGVGEEEEEPDYDELAALIGEKIHIPTVSEDVIADKAAAVLSNYLPDIDTDEIADKVANQVLSALSKTEEEPEALQIELDYDALAEKLASSLSEDNHTDERLDSIDKNIVEIKTLLENGVQVTELAPAAAEQISDDESEELVKVSDIVPQDDGPSDEPTYEEEDVRDPKTVPSGDEENSVIGDEFSETSGGVDFLNMMKYNRSFIARIIQGTDDQKEYYGRIKNALLSYKKVNSNIAWGAERFHKGRETIARLKIRGKTLILYLALDPAEVPYSVYHHKDVSDNKSLHGTPLAVKVMSPLGVKKAIRLIDAMLEKRDGIKRPIPERDYADMYPYESIEELIADGLVQDVRKP